MTRPRVGTTIKSGRTTSGVAVRTPTATPLVARESAQALVKEPAAKLLVREQRTDAVTVVRETSDSIQGPAGPTGPAGPSGQDAVVAVPEASFVFDVPAKTWHMPHNLGRKLVDIVTVDQGDNEVIGDPVYVDINTAYVEWYYPMTGSATVSL